MELPSPVPFRVVDNNIGLDVDISIRCFGEYSYRMTNPMLFYTNVCGNIDGDYTRDQIDSQLKSELLTALQPAFAKISEMGIRYSALPGHTAEIAGALNEVLSEKWVNLRGVEIVSFGVNSVNASEEDEDMIKDLQRNAVFRNANMAAAHLVGAQAQAMQDAANNRRRLHWVYGPEHGPAGRRHESCAAVPDGRAATGAGCSAECAGSAKRKCVEMHLRCDGYRQILSRVWRKKARDQPTAGWTCACGEVNAGRFCSECGAKRPAGAPVYRCDKCGWQPEDPMHPPKFCPECGDPFDEDDCM